MSSEIINANDLKTILERVLPSKNYPAIYVSTSDPTSADGNDGDLWLKYEEPASE